MTRSLPISRHEALEWVKSEIKTKNLVKHILAVEAGCRELAEHFGEDADYWGLAGLLHDIDYEKTQDSPALHTKMASGWLREKNIDEDIIYAVMAHAEQVEPKSKMDWALFTVDPTTGPHP